MNSLSSFQSTEQTALVACDVFSSPAPIVSMRLQKAQDTSLQTLQRVRQALEERFSGLVGENSVLRRELISATLQNRELVSVQHRETSSLQEQLEETRAELAHVREEKEREKATLYHEIDTLRADLKRTKEESLSQEQETAQTLAKLREELQQAREDTLQRIKVFQTEKEVVANEAQARTMQQVAQSRAEERALLTQDFERRIVIFQSEKKEELSAMRRRTRDEVIDCYIQRAKKEFRIFMPFFEEIMPAEIRIKIQ